MKKCCGEKNLPSCICKKKTIIFDLDGVLADSVKIHQTTFNQALQDVLGLEYVVANEVYKKTYEGLTTNEKLKKLHNQYPNISLSDWEEVYNRKQELTLVEYSKFEVNNSLITLLNKLGPKFNLICCTNSNKKISHLLLEKLGIKEHFLYILTSEDITNKKPHPEIYWKAMLLTKSHPDQTLIVEDSKVGLVAAASSGAKVYRITFPGNISYTKILNYFNKSRTKMNVLSHDTLTVVVPMAGIGSRFSKAGFTLPKPLIDVDGRTMIRAVVDSLNVQAKYIFIVLKEHVQNFNIDKIVREIVPTCEVVVVEEVTEGAVATILTAKQFINNDNPILIVNSDNIILWDPVDFFTEVENTYLDGSIVYFEDDNPKWSFITIQDNLITKVAEKQVISNFATSGIYYWKKGSDFVKYAEDMINNNIRVNNEFYVAPVYNLAIGDGKKIGPYQIDKEEMWGVGTPEDLNFYIENNT